ncbi:beta-galactosidase [Kitasatospora sp. NPDC001603]|uniref:beta-galactosidase n=1 Tax=Kitasatospora sp. NPDC001603 TaxID=3154388 RepID=UPI00332618D6
MRDPARRPLLRRGLAIGAAVAFLAGPGSGAPAAPAPVGTPTARAPHSVTYDGYSFLIDGRRTYLWSGEFHSYRLPSPDLWLDVLQKMRAAGFNAVSLYFDWGYHSPAPGVYDFTGIRDIDRLLSMADSLGLYVIARPGPYINAEVDGGGFPGWLSTKPGDNRRDEPRYLAYSDEWQRRIDRIIARHQFTNGTGSVIQYQVENEYFDNGPDGRAYMKHLEDRAKADGITVPLVGNNNGAFQTGHAALDVDSPDSYPQGFDCSHPATWRGVPDISRGRLPDKPLGTAEFQGGAFDPWGGPGYDKCAELINDRFADVFYKQNIAVGATLQSLYMTYGGTNWGWLGMPQNYTSYDYGAAISETRRLDPKYHQDKLIGYFAQAVAPLTKTDPLSAAPTDNARIVDTARANPDTGTQFHVLRHADSTAVTRDSAHLTVDVGGRSYTVPQQPGTALTLDGRQSKVILAGYDLGKARLRYSTSELMTDAAIGDQHVAVLYGDHDSDGETVLHYATRPTVTATDVTATDGAATGGAVTSTWDPTTGDLRLNYRHTGLTRVRITGGDRPLLLLLADTGTAKTFWRQDTAHGPVLLRGSHLLRGAASDGTTLALTGDVGTDGAIEVFGPAGALTWNGTKVSTHRTDTGSLTGTVPTAAPVTLPALTDWRHTQDSPEARPGFDDSGWRVADRNTSNSTTGPVTLPVLFADDYGFHTGSTWYRGRFTGTGAETGITLTTQSGGGAAASSAWLNGTFLGSSTTDGTTYAFPAGLLRSGGDNVVSVLTVDMGHEEDYEASNGNKAARGLLGASLLGAPPGAVTWRLQGNLGGETPVDPVRGPLAVGGLHGERAGYMLPGYPTKDWTPTRLPATDPTPGVSWYTTTVPLDLPAGQDTSLGLTLTDDPSRRYRAEIFVNGWHLGNYVNYLGPQHSFPVPNGILDPHGTNTVAIAVWNLDGSTGGLGGVALTAYGSYASSLAVRQNDSPRYDSGRYEP